MTVPNPHAVNANMFGSMFKDRVFIATVNAVSGGVVKIIRPGQATADTVFYPAAQGLSALLSVGDHVLVIVVANVPTVIAKIVIS